VILFFVAPLYRSLNLPRFRTVQKLTTIGNPTLPNSRRFLLDNLDIVESRRLGGVDVSVTFLPVRSLAASAGETRDSGLEAGALTRYSPHEITHIPGLIRRAHLLTCSP
jgi:hypothetical protein